MDPRTRDLEASQEPLAPRRGPVEVLVVHARPEERHRSLSLLERAGYAPVGVEDGRAAIELAPHLQPRVALVDDALVDMAAGHVARELARLVPGCEVHLVGEGDRIVPLHLLGRPGAEGGLRSLHPAREASGPGGRPSGRGLAGGALDALVGHSPQMRSVKALVSRAAASDASVLITGESGTGKELLARALHALSPRADGPFVAVNCAALPDALLESELFGHERGAFTGASSRKQGRFELAHGGSLFLDEIGDIPQSTQVKLLRVLQERAFERVGGTNTLHVDVRVLAATNSDLRRRAREGGYRDDLFYRLNVLSVVAPPLRERQQDIPLLWSHFLADLANAERRPVPDTAPEVAGVLIGHDWPGNVRELRNVAHYAMVMCQEQTVRLEHLPPYLGGADATEADPLALQVPGMTLAELEQAAILRTYEALGHNARRTAAMLDISLRKVRYRLKAYREQGLLPAREPASSD